MFRVLVLEVLIDMSNMLSLSIIYVYVFMWELEYL